MKADKSLKQTQVAIDDSYQTLALFPQWRNQLSSYCKDKINEANEHDANLRRRLPKIEVSMEESRKPVRKVLERPNRSKPIVPHKRYAASVNRLNQPISKPIVVAGF